MAEGSNEDMVRLKDHMAGHVMVAPPDRVAGIEEKGTGQEDIVKTTDIRVSVGDDDDDVERLERHVSRNVTRMW